MRAAGSRGGHRPRSRQARWCGGRAGAGRRSRARRPRRRGRRAHRSRGVQRHEGLDVPINNAGTIEGWRALRMSSHQWRATIDTNLTGAYLCAKHAAKTMIERGRGGKIINVASSTRSPARRPRHVDLVAVAAHRRDCCVRRLRGGRRVVGGRRSAGGHARGGPLRARLRGAVPAPARRQSRRAVAQAADRRAGRLPCDADRCRARLHPRWPGNSTTRSSPCSCCARSCAPAGASSCASTGRARRARWQCCCDSPTGSLAAPNPPEGGGC
jgi:short chain dehydrogenase